MMTSIPRDSADLANSKSRSGVRCAETILVSCGTSNSVRISDAALIVSQSDLLPIITATKGFSLINLFFEFGFYHRLKLFPRVNGAAPIDDLSVFADDYIFWVSLKPETVERRLRV